MKARPNRSMQSPVSKQMLDQYTEWHWGNKPEKVIDWPDPDFPEGALIECGRLVRIDVRLPERRGVAIRNRGARNRDSSISLTRTHAQNSHLAYDPNHPHQRLYLLIPPEVRREMKKKFFYGNSLPPQLLSAWAQATGGRHGTPDYPSITVKPIGIITGLVYYTNKKGDGLSFYHHAVGEVSGVMPILCCDEKGRLWIVGGNTTAPTPGITD